MSTRVMTGGMSGFGAIAAKRLTLLGNARLILGTRRPTTVGESIPLDLTELDSVRAFATSVREWLDDTPVDALVLNAGVVLPDVTGRTVDGYPRHEPWACDGRSVMTREVEVPIWKYVKELLSDPMLLKARYEEGQGDPAVDNEEEREKERIGRKLKALEREIGRLIDDYQAEVIDLSELKERREGIEEHGRMLKRRLAEIREKRADREQEIRLLEGLEQFSESVRDLLVEPPFETRQQVLRLVVDKIVVEDDKVVIHHVVPTGPVRLQTRQLPRTQHRELRRTRRSAPRTRWRASTVPGSVP